MEWRLAAGESALALKDKPPLKADAAASGVHSGSGGVGAKPVRVERRNGTCRVPDDTGSLNLALLFLRG
jgi:hypothetical protein